VRLGPSPEIPDSLNSQRPCTFQGQDPRCGVEKGRDDRQKQSQLFQDVSEISPPSIALRASSFYTSRELLFPSLWLRTKVKPFPNSGVLGKTRYHLPLMFSKVKRRSKHWIVPLAHNEKSSCQAPYLSSRLNSFNQAWI
jgi:hypothetical protein